MKQLFLRFRKRVVPMAWAALAICVGTAFPAAFGQTVQFSYATKTLGGGFSRPAGAAVDGSGNVYIADYIGSAVREIPSGCTSSSCVTTLGGGFNAPAGVAVDGSGNVYIADTNNNVVKKMPSGCTSSSCVTTLGGGFGLPWGIAVDPNGNVYVGDSANNAVKKMSSGCTSSSCVSTLGGGFNAPAGVAVDGSGNVYIADTNNNVVKKMPSGCTSSSCVTTLGSFSYPYGIAVDGNGNVYVGDWGASTMMEIPSGCASSSCASALGTGFAGPVGIAVDGNLNVYVADFGDQVVKEVMTQSVALPSTAIGQTSQSLTLNFTFTAGGSIGAPVVLTQGATGLDFADAGTGTCTTNGAAHVYNAGDTCTVNLAFTPRFAGSRNGAVEIVDNKGSMLATTFITGTGTGPQIAYGPLPEVTIGSGLSYPFQVAEDGAGNLFIADSGNKRVVKVTSSGTQSVVASNVEDPGGVAVDGAGNVFVAADAQVLKVSPTGAETTMGSGLGGLDNIAVDAAGNIYVADPSNKRVVKFTSAGAQTTVLSGLSEPEGVAVDGSGDLFVADLGDDLVVKLTPAGVQSQIRGSLYGPTAVAIDGGGNLFVVDGPQDDVVEFVSTGGQATIATGLNQPHGVTVDAGGNIFIADTWNGRVLKLPRSQPPTLTFAQTFPGFTSADSPQSVTVENIGTEPLTFSGISIPSGFQQVAGSGSPEDCSASATLTPNVSCNISISFEPQSVGTFSTPVVLTDNASPGTQSIPLSGTGEAKLNQTINFNMSGFSFQVPQLLTLDNAIPTSGLPATYTSQTPAVCSIEVSNNVYFAQMNEAGTCTITASQAGNYEYNAATPVTQSFTVNGESQTITFGAISTQSQGTPLTLSATASSGLTVSYTATPFQVCTVSGNTVTFVNGGPCTVTASQSGNTMYAAATSVSQSFNVLKLPAMNISHPGMQLVGSSVTVLAGSSDPAATITLASQTPGVCTVSGTSATMIAVGTCTIQASQPADSQYAADTISTSFQVNQRNQTITFTGLPSTATYSQGLSYTLNATASSGLTVSYSVSGPATISGSTLNITGTGTVTVTANQAGNTQYSAATAVSQTLTVNAATPTVTFTGLPTTATFGAAGPYTLAATSTSGGTASYSVTGPATITGSTLTINGAGTVVVTASFAATGNYTTASASQTIVVSLASQTITFTGLPGTATFGAAGPYTLAATSTSGGTASYSVTGPATVTGSTLTINGAGTVVVTASFAATGNYTAASASQTIVVSQASQTITFTGLPTTATFGAAGPYTLAATSTSGGTASYSVTGPATVTGSTLTINGAGTVVVTASFAATGNYTAASASQTIVVSHASQTITFTGLPATATYGTAGPYTLNGTASSGLPVSYTVSGPATVSGNTLTLTGAGTVVVTASQPGNANYSAAVSVSQTISVSAPGPTYDAAITVQYASTRLVYPGATNITVCIAPAHNITATGTVQIYDGTALLTTQPVQGGGCAYWYIAPGLTAGQHSLTAVYSGDRNNPGGTSAPTILNVAPVPVNMAPACWLTNSGYGANYQCTVSLSSNAGAAQGVITYSYDGAAPVIVPIGNGTANFTLTKPAAGNHSVVIAFAQQTNYAAAGPVTENFTVAPAAVNVSLSPSSWYTSASGGVNFTATINCSSAGAPSSTGSVEFFDGGTLLAAVPVNANGQASYSTAKLTSGSHTITATYTGSTNYASGSAEINITLTK